MKIDVEIPGFQKILDEADAEIGTAATEAMRTTTPDAVRELREQITGAGLGTRLANTWRGNVYPKDKRSLNPSGYIYSNAPAIIESFTRGATIRPVKGGNYLWIPTDNVPRSRGTSASGRRTRGGKMSPEEVENTYNTDLEIVKGKAGTLLAFITASGAKNAKGRAKPTRGRVATKGKGKNRVEPVLMFVLRKSVTMPRPLDLNGPTRRWGDNFVREFTNRIGG